MKKDNIYKFEYSFLQISRALALQSLIFFLIEIPEVQCRVLLKIMTNISSAF